MANPTTTTNKALLIMSIMLAGMMLVACGHYDQEGTYRNFGDAGWRYGDTVSVESADSMPRLVDLAVGIRHTNRYEYSNLWVELTYSVPVPVAPDTTAVDSAAVTPPDIDAAMADSLAVDSAAVAAPRYVSEVRRDTFDIRLADVYGNWHGQGVGVGYQLVDTVLRRRLIDLSQPVTMRHIMRVDSLGGIEQAGIIIKKLADTSR